MAFLCTLVQPPSSAQQAVVVQAYQLVPSVAVFFHSKRAKWEGFQKGSHGPRTQGSFFSIHGPLHRGNAHTHTQGEIVYRRTKERCRETTKTGMSWLGKRRTDAGLERRHGRAWKAPFAGKAPTGNPTKPVSDAPQLLPPPSTTYPSVPNHAPLVFFHFPSRSTTLFTVRASLPWDPQLHPTSRR